MENLLIVVVATNNSTVFGHHLPDVYYGKGLGFARNCQFLEELYKWYDASSTRKYGHYDIYTWIFRWGFKLHTNVKVASSLKMLVIYEMSLFRWVVKLDLTLLRFQTVLLTSKPQQDRKFLLIRNTKILKSFILFFFFLNWGLLFLLDAMLESKIEIR